MFLAIAAAALIAGAEPPADTTTGATAVATAPTTEPQAGERKIRVVCRTETPTGTRFGKRVCLPVDEFKRRQEESREGFVEMQRSHNVNYTNGN